MESILKSEPESRILDLCERALGPKGFRTVDVDCHVSGRSLIRIFIERQQAAVPPTPDEPGVSIDDCAEASRLIGPILDETEGLIPAGYDLEVSSPGLDRRLRVDSDFAQVVGEEVKLKLIAAIPGVGANLTGKLLSVEKDFILVLTQGKEVPVPLRTIKRANRVWHLK